MNYLSSNNWWQERLKNMTYTVRIKIKVLFLSVFNRFYIIPLFYWYKWNIDLFTIPLFMSAWHFCDSLALFKHYFSKCKHRTLAFKQIITIIFMPKIPVLTGSNGRHPNGNLLNWRKQFQLSLQECFMWKSSVSKGRAQHIWIRGRSGGSWVSAFDLSCDTQIQISFPSGFRLFPFFAFHHLLVSSPSILG